MGEEEKVKEPIKFQRSWTKVVFHIHMHFVAINGAYLLLTQATWATFFLFTVLIFWGMIGLSVGSHRLWAHKTFQAPWTLRTFLATGQLFACEGSILNWAIWHRFHHKHHGTDLDPFDYRRGFWFTHYGSRCLIPSPEQEKAKEEIPTSDLEDDNVVYFQNLFYAILMPIIGLLLPCNTAMAYCGESFGVAVLVIGFLRVVVLQNLSWLINSGYLIWGLDPLDKRSSDTWLVFFFNKSLWPQYHYLLSWDYRSGEYGTYDSGCCTTALRVFAALGLATKLTTISSNGVKSAMAKAVETERPLAQCLEEAKIVLPDIINQDPSNN